MNASHDIIFRSQGASPPLLRYDLEHIIEHAEEVLRELRHARIFITGGTGFFGRWLLEGLLHARERLRLSMTAVILTRNPDSFRESVPHLAAHPMFTLLEGDIRHFPFPSGEFSHILHAGSTAPPNQLDELFSVLIEGTRRVLGFARQARCRRLLFVSSGAVYGEQPSRGRILESNHIAPDPMQPLSAYGEAKRVAELLCAAACRDTPLETVIARCFSFICPLLPLDGSYAAGNFIRDALNKTPVRIQGDGHPTRSYLYMADLVVWLLTLLANGQSCHPYNVGSDDSISIGALATLVRDTLNPGTPVEIQGEPVSTSRRYYVPDITRAQRELGLDIHIPLDEAIQRTASWLKLLRPQPSHFCANDHAGDH